MCYGADGEKTLINLRDQHCPASISWLFRGRNVSYSGSDQSESSRGPGDDGLGASAPIGKGYFSKAKSFFPALKQSSVRWSREQSSLFLSFFHSFFFSSPSSVLSGHSTVRNLLFEKRFTAIWTFRHAQWSHHCSHLSFFYSEKHFKNSFNIWHHDKPNCLN